MGRIVDIGVNFKPHTELKLYDVLGIDRATARAFDPEGYLRQMDQDGVAMTGIVANTVQNGVRGELLMTHVDEVQPVIEKDPDRFFGWVGINPLGGMETLRYIEYAVTELGFKGVHVYPHWFGVPINDRTYWPIYAKCCELGVPISLQVGRQSPRSGAKLCARPEWIEEAAFDFPELTLLGLHIGVPFDFEMTSAAIGHENVYIIADAHPPSTWTPHFIEYLSGRGFLNIDGAQKVMWGTDWPVQDLSQSLKEVRALNLPEDVEAGLLGENAIRILGLDL
ncbi:amidohydrolase family protein [Aestuariivita sp.]|jgi:predicted TIM-barrel fold metal-dependent hydrolase|uniref:amidohydrolase family protein n=1 Tax=Aestuariivita sp. TaxID=1872407 RepID=UPI00216D291F|nr:amidohydrolase family protein [Aestuariivita sp.]MCE8006103.1 amidohydrolase [Aestuariivita sp.]